MNKSIFLVFFAVFLSFLSVALEYYKIAKVASLGVLIGFILGMYGFVIHMRIIYKELFNKDDDSSKET